jgi:triacylglycerol esterase/lipase EstA (alpha/beta hydrolase family)
MSLLLSRLGGVAFVVAVTTGLLAAPTGSAVADGQSPPGANDWSCKPTVRHPLPVVLVEGTFESMAKNWIRMSPYLKDKGYCIFALDYGTTHGVQATGPIAKSARQLSKFVDKVRAATKVNQVDLVGHSQGGMMPRYYLRFLGGAAKVDKLIGIAPSNHGTKTPLVLPPAWPAGAVCQACLDQMAGSPFLTKLNAGGDLQPGPFYTVISTKNDEVVTPYTSQALAGPRSRVTNIVIQDDCPLDQIEHDQTPNDPVVQQLVSAALNRKNGPADPHYRPKCT